MTLINNTRIPEAKHMHIYKNKEKQNEKELDWKNIWGQ